jgi:VWFA-related protein
MLLLLAALTAASAFAQTSEVIEVHLLEVEASVVDRAGKPVENLEQKDFDVTIDGKAADISNFYLVRRGEIVEEPQSGAASAPQAAPEKVPSRIAFFIDDVHLHERTKKRALDAVIKYVESLDPSASVMLVRWNGSLQIALPATRDKSAILAAVRELAAQPARGRVSDTERRQIMDMYTSKIDEDEVRQHVLNYAETQASLARTTIAALQDITRILGGFAGRRMLLYVSEGLPQFPGLELTSVVEQNIPGQVLSLDQTRNIQRLNAYAQASGVVFCPFDPSGPDGMRYAVETGGGRVDVMRTNARPTAELMARETGGQLIADTNDLDTALAVLDRGVTTYYSLGVPAPEGKRGPFNIAVRVKNHPDLRVVTAARRGVTTRAQEVAAAVQSHLYLREEVNPLGVKVKMGEARKDGQRCIVPLMIALPSNRLTLLPAGDAEKGELSVHFAVADERQQESQVKTTSKEVWPRKGSEVTELIALSLQPKKYVVSIAVTDDIAGEASYVQREIDARGCMK